MRFSGSYSTALSESSTLLRAGYVGCNNVVRLRVHTHVICCVLGVCLLCLVNVGPMCCKAEGDTNKTPLLITCPSCVSLCPLQLPKSLDLSMHDYLEFRIRSRDGHTYVASVRTDNYTGGDEEVWQAPLRPSR